MKLCAKGAHRLAGLWAAVCNSLAAPRGLGLVQCCCWVALQKKFNEALGNRDFSCTPWLESVEGADPQAASDAGAALPDPAALKPGMVKKQAYSSSSMGVKVGCRCSMGPNIP